MSRGMSRELLRAMTAEAIGTFALVFAGCGAIMVGRAERRGRYVDVHGHSRPGELDRRTEPAQRRGAGSGRVVAAWAGGPSAPASGHTDTGVPDPDLVGTLA
jgi:glycerol uptake facilitator-like aquaporin